MIISKKRDSFKQLIDCVVFNAIFNGISVISQRPVHLSMLSWSSFLISTPTIFFLETTDSCQRGMNHVAMTIINPRREYWPSRG